jgi:hypothetical protein
MEALSHYLQSGDLGNRSRYEDLSFGRRKKLADLILAEMFQRKGRFLDQIVNGIWAVCEESFWGVPAHIGAQKAGRGLPDVTEPVVDLFAAETGAMLAWIYYLLKPELDKINPLIAKRIEVETDRRIITPYFEREDWGWMGYTYRKRTGYMRPVNNWNPWINSNVLACVLILEKDPVRRLKIVHKIMDSIDIFMEPYPSDGGCDEGPSYWGRAGASLFDCLELLHSVSNGKINIYHLPLIQQIGKYIYRTYIGDPYFINFADASAKMRIEPATVYRYGKAIGDNTMQQFAAFTAKVTGFGSTAIPGSFGCLNRQLPALFLVKEMLTMEPREPLIRDVWLPNIQLMAARSNSGSKEDFYLAAKGGHNDESHNHNDVGNFIIYFNGHPVFIDAGAQTYTAKTFSSKRYDLWNNQSAYHNLPSINGIMQKDGRLFEAKDITYRSDSKLAVLQLDISKPQLEKMGRIKLVNTLDNKFSDFYLIYDGKKFETKVETVKINDSRMHRSWGDKLFRIILISKNKKLKDNVLIKIAKK